jgi:hypothetical protein
MPEWFKVGAKLWFMGFGEENEVVSIHEDFIDDDDAYWVARTFDGDVIYPLNEVAKYWRPQHDGWDK